MLFESIGIFVLEMFMKYKICFIGWLGIFINLRLVVLIPKSRPLASLIMPLLFAKFAIVLIMTVILISVIFLLMVLIDL